MKRRTRAVAILALLLGLGRFAVAEQSKANTTLVIKGMTCGGCVAAVKVQLKKTPGVTAYEVSLEKGEATVTYDPARTDPKKIAESVSKTGFEARVKGEKKTEALPDAVPVATIDLARFRDWFNGASDSVRILSILSPT